MSNFFLKTKDNRFAETNELLPFSLFSQVDDGEFLNTVRIKRYLFFLSFATFMFTEPLKSASNFFVDF